MSIKSRLGRLERAGPAAPNALEELLASIASRGLRIHELPADLPMPTQADPKEVAAMLEALCRAPSLAALSREARA
jgi:hypothetical protein